MTEYKVSIAQFANELNLETICAPASLEELYIQSAEVSRPGLMFAGFAEHFDPRRIQIVGLMEHTYLQQMSDEERLESINSFMERKPILVVICRSLPIYNEFIDAADKYGVAVCRSSEKTSDFMSAAISFLNVELAPMTLQHGELVEVYGEGILILGDSGVGKSEAVIELIKRGHRMVADDSVELRRVSDKTIVGNPPANIQYFVELRGIGIINVREIFGMGAIKARERVDLVINLERWIDGKSYSHIGMGNETINILGLDLPIITIPVSAGRNLAVIIEVAAMNYRNLKLGYNAEQELLTSLGLTDDLN